ncbi:hypothetical protein D9613_011532 [Agrocybe pediades]|uniref:Uncharacterized protein n=1 Tax=Agrocybe pediades TaxID=84607 RepID=A0A8H4QVK1_9AGAR|nr:hypothetical protein D9613_011532 [Agrocybe pediades]
MQVWRCFRACGQSFRTFFLPLLLFIVEIALVISSLVYTCLVEVKPGFLDSHTAGIDDHLEAAMYISVGATSLIATFIICYQIYMRTAPYPHTRKRYRNIIDSLVQSSGTYSAIVVVLGIMQATESGESQTSFKIQLALSYLETFSYMAAGLAPTLMVARLSMAPTHEGLETLSDSLPSDLVSDTSQSTSTNVQDHQGDVEMQ